TSSFEGCEVRSLLSMENIKGASFIPIEITRPPLFAGGDERFNASNPSILKTPEGYKVICRTHNYAQNEKKWCYSRDPNSPICTINFLLDYDKDFNLLSQKEIVEDVSRVRVPARAVGLEDCRLALFEGETYFTCSEHETVPGKITEALCKLEGNV